MLLRTENLTKYYGSFLALDHLNLEVEEGEIFGFVGPNGAGKTTSMRILATLMTATSGDAFLNGVSVRQSPMAIRGMMGYMPDFFGVYDNLRVTEYLDFYGDAYGVDKGKRRVMISELLELVNLGDKADHYVDALSRGMKQRLCLARCLIHDPKLLILDEPASGMDPQARAEMKYILKALKEQGKSILISSHILPELGELCDRVAIINKGKLMAMGTIDEISKTMGERTKVKFTLLSSDDLESAAAILRTHEAVGEIMQENQTLEVSLSGEDKEIAELVRRLALSNVGITAVQKTVQSLEQVFLEVISSEEK